MKTTTALLLLNLSVLTGATLTRLRRSQLPFDVSGFEFGRGPKLGMYSELMDARQLIEEMSMPLDVDVDMSIPLDTDMSFPIEEAMSFPIEDGMSFPIGTDMSFPFDGVDVPDIGFGGDVDATAPPTTTTTTTDESPTPAPSPIVDDADPSCSDPTTEELDTMASTSVQLVLEVDTFATNNSFVDELTSKLLIALTEDFALCSTASRALVVERRKLEADVAAVKLGSKTGLSTEDSCGVSGNAPEDAVCHVVKVEFEVYTESDSSSEEAAEDVASALSSRLSDEEEDLFKDTSIVGVRVRETTPATGDSAMSGKGSAAGKERSMSPAKKAMISILAVAGASIAFVVVQRRLSQKKRGDDKSVGSSVETASNTGYDTTAICSQEANSLA